MISSLHGTVSAIDGSIITVITHGIGFSVAVSNPSLYHMQDSVTLAIAWTWSAEQGPQLFGFQTTEERVFFNLITTCQGIGPKLAMSMLGQATATWCVNAIVTGDVKGLSGLKGIGTKKAELLIMQLRDKCSGLSLSEDATPRGIAGQKMRDISDALKALGYATAEISHALALVKAREDAATASFDQLMRAALSGLAKGS